MSTPTIGVGRISVPYTVTGLAHVCRMFVDNPTVSGGTYLIGKRPSIGGTNNWVQAAVDFAAAISYVLPTGTTVGAALLEEYSATGWLPRATTAVTLPNLSGNAALASEMVLTLRCDTFARPKIVVMEQNGIAPSKFTSPTGGAGAQDAMVAEFLGTGSLSFNPWVFMTNMHGFFLTASPFVSFTTTYNRKLRRARGLA